MTSKEELEKIIALSSLNSPNDIQTFLFQFDEIINYFNILDELEIKEQNIENIFNIFRDDIEIQTDLLDQKIILKNAIVTNDGYIKAPWVKL